MKLLSTFLLPTITISGQHGNGSPIRQKKKKKEKDTGLERKKVKLVLFPEGIIMFWKIQKNL